VHNELVRRAVLAALIALTVAPVALARTDGPRQIAPPPPQIAWHQSQPLGLWWSGHLRAGVQLPAEGPDWFTWDPPLKTTPNRGWRRWGTDRLIRTLLEVIAQYRLENPGVPRVGIGDLSRRHGGDFGRRFGGLGHASHQNGLDADVYYARLDGLERRAYKPSQVDQVLAQDLLNRFLAAGARVVYVGPHLDLVGPRKKVVPLVYHDDHMHVRLPLRP
jgi:murein endopeptidase